MTRTLTTEIVSVNTEVDTRTMMTIRASHGKVTIDTSQPHNVLFRTDKAIYEAEFCPVPTSQVEYIEQLVDGYLRTFAVYPTIRLTANDESFPECMSGIGYCADAQQMMLLREAVNVIGGKISSSAPVSSISYRRLMPKARSFPVQEVVVTNVL